MMEKMRAQLARNQDLYGINQVATTSEANNGKFGEIPGVKVGDSWDTREKCANAKVHIASFAGIAGSAEHGAYSVVLSAGYEDDEDKGDVFIYTGTGGRDSDKGGSFGGQKMQTEDQTFQHHDNAALLTSSRTGRPVRVVRGPNPNSTFAPLSGYRYDGLYVVENAELALGRSGFKVCKFTFRKWSSPPKN